MKLEFSFAVSGRTFGFIDTGARTLEEGEGEAESFLRLRRRAERSCSGFDDFEEVSFGL